MQRKIVPARCRERFNHAHRPSNMASVSPTLVLPSVSALCLIELTTFQMVKKAVQHHDLPATNTGARIMSYSCLPMNFRFVKLSHHY